jgi:hypothetical protein
MFGAFWLKRARRRSAVLRQPVVRLGERAVVFLQLFAAEANIGVAFGIVGEVAARKGSVARISVEAPAERLPYAVLLAPDRSKQDALTVVGVNRRSANRGRLSSAATCPNAATSFITSTGTPIILPAAQKISCSKE